MTEQELKRWYEGQNLTIRKLTIIQEINTMAFGFSKKILANATCCSDRETALRKVREAVWYAVAALGDLPDDEEEGAQE